jgi:hypothetical protein
LEEIRRYEEGEDFTTFIKPQAKIRKIVEIFQNNVEEKETVAQ